MKLQTKVLLNKAENQIDYNSRILLLGSCFSNNIGEKFEYYKFQTLQNPFGILFHPKAIETLVHNALLNKNYTADDVFFLNERWHCFDAHSDLSASSKSELLDKLNGGLEKIHEQITKATHIFITLGTAWAYNHLATGKVIANCHKVPQKDFSKALLTVSEIGDSLANIKDRIQAVNKKAQLIFTVSPVRHLKDGFVENQRSKSHLIFAIHAAMNSPSPGGGRGEVYFPSYEIMMDELRDYRFYAADMVHPNPLAIDYIWEKLKAVWISENVYSTMEEINEIQKGLAHRPFNTSSEAHEVFTRSLQQKITYLKERYPLIRFDT